MWIFDHNIEWAARPPFERQSPWVVDPNVPSPFVLFEVIARWRSHETQQRRCIELSQLSLGNLLDVGKAGAATGGEQLLGVRTSKGSNGHDLRFICYPVNGQSHLFTFCFGIYPTRNFIHLDAGRVRSWQRFDHTKASAGLGKSEELKLPRRMRVPLVHLGSAPNCSDPC
jgi:hypothetical protein